MVIGSEFASDQIVTAHVEAIKFGLDHDIVDQTHILFYGNESKATIVTALCGGKIVGRKAQIRRRG